MNHDQSRAPFPPARYNARLLRYYGRWRISQSAALVKKSVHSREVAAEDLVIREPKDLDAPHPLEPSVHAPVVGRVLVARTIDLDRKPVLG